MVADRRFILSCGGRIHDDVVKQILILIKITGLITACCCVLCSHAGTSFIGFLFRCF